MIPDLRERVQADAIRDERVWFSEFGGVGFGESPDIDTVESVVNDHAERIEQSMNCVAIVVRDEQPGPSHTSDIVALALVAGRSADLSVLQDAFGTLDHRIREEIAREIQ